jgi:hypothetical protein
MTPDPRAPATAETEPVRERPILFSAPMVRAILEGRKTQTRRVVKPQPPEGAKTGWYQDVLTGDRRWGWETEFVSANGGELEYADGTVRPLGVQKCPTVRCPHGTVGTRLWVRETWRAESQFYDQAPADIPLGRPVWYEADKPQERFMGRRRPSIHMPRWASRLTLEVVSVRAERLQEITEEDARAEGCGEESPFFNAYEPHHDLGSVDAFRELWDSINSKTYPWNTNPWVWVIAFSPVPAPLPCETCGAAVTDGDRGEGKRER